MYIKLLCQGLALNEYQFKAKFSTKTLLIKFTESPLPQPRHCDLKDPQTTRVTKSGMALFAQHFRG